jgi:hypothetical protein
LFTTFRGGYPLHWGHGRWPGASLKRLPLSPMPRRCGRARRPPRPRRHCWGRSERPSIHKPRPTAMLPRASSPSTTSTVPSATSVAPIATATTTHLRNATVGGEGLSAECFATFRRQLSGSLHKATRVAPGITRARLPRPRQTVHMHGSSREPTRDLITSLRP